VRTTPRLPRGSVSSFPTCAIQEYSVRHIDLLEIQLDLIKRIGLELYTQSHLGGLVAEEH
jgi:bacterioferritin (cytochrome b1)